MDPDPSDSIPALLDAIPAPDPDPQTSGIITPLAHTSDTQRKEERGSANLANNVMKQTWCPSFNSYGVYFEQSSDLFPLCDVSFVKRS